MHGVPLSLLEQQANSLSIPLFLIEIPEETDMDRYTMIMNKRIVRTKKQNIDVILYW
jgi:hypothetical protein